MYVTQKVVAIIVIILVIAAVIFGVSKYFEAESKTTKLGFEDIGELAAQSAYCTEVNVTETARELFGLEIPFTESKWSVGKHPQQCQDNTYWIFRQPVCWLTVFCCAADPLQVEGILVTISVGYPGSEEKGKRDGI